MKTIVLTFVLIVTVGLFIGCGSKESNHGDDHEDHAGEEHTEALPSGANKMCPVLTEEKVDPSLYVEYNDKRIYVCCKKCLKRVKKDPAAWYAKAYGNE